MANQKEIRVKIASTKKTMKITSAMKLVAAAKVNKMQKNLLATRPYSQKITDLFTNLQSALTDDDIAANPVFQSSDQVETVLVLAVGSDRGLCGAYNANIIKATNRRVEQLIAEGKQVKLVTVGRKIKVAFVKLEMAGLELVKSFANLSSVPTSTEASLISEFAVSNYLDGKVDRVEIISTRFISLVSNEVERNDFLPISSEAGEEASSEAIFEPDTQTLVDTLVPMYTENRIYQALMEATTSELAARMTAMSNATNNAKEVIRKLVLEYNKARQASITQEISEIVGGAAALG